MLPGCGIRPVDFGVSPGDAAGDQKVSSANEPQESAAVPAEPTDEVASERPEPAEDLANVTAPVELPWPLDGNPEVLAEFDHHSEYAYEGGHHCHSVAWSPDGRLIASGGADGRVVVRDLLSETIVREWQPYPDPVTLLEFSPDGEFLLSDTSQGNVMVWSVADWSMTAEHPGGPALFLPDGGLMNRLRNGDFALLQSATSTEPQILALERSNVARISASADGQRFITANWGQSAVVRAVGEGDWVDRTAIEGRAAGLDSDGAMAVIGGSELHLYDVEASRELWRCAPRVYCETQFSPDQRLVLAGGWGLPLSVWDLSGRCVHRYQSTRPAADFAFSPDGRFVVTAGTDGIVRVVRLPAADSIARRAANATRTAVDLLNRARQTAEPEERLKLLDEANMLDATMPEPSFERAVVLSEMNRLDDADREYRRAINLLKRAPEERDDHSDDRETLLAWSYLNNCDVLLRAGRVKEATRFGDGAVETAPGMPMAQYNRGRAHLQHHSYGPALKSLEAAVQMGMPNALVLHGHALTDLNETAAAIRDYEAALQLLGPDPAALYVYGQLLRMTGRYEESLRMLQLYSQLAPDDPSAPTFLGNSWLMLGDQEQALRSYQTAVESNADDPIALLHLGDLQHQTGDTGSAEVSYRTAVKLVAEQDDQTAWNRATIGQHQALQRSYAEAIASYEAALDLDERHHWTLSNLAWLLATCPNETLRDGQRAVELADSACELTLNRSWLALSSRAAALAEVGRFDEAVETQRDVLERAPHVEKPALRDRLAAFEAGRPYRERTDVEYFVDGRPVSVDPDEVPVAGFAALEETSGEHPRLTTEQIAERYSDAVVLIRSEESTGTGVILSEDGYVLTCAHVLPWSVPLSVEYHLSDALPNQNETAPAEALVIDFRNDLALLKFEPVAAATTVWLALRADVDAGADVVVIGNPGNGTVVLPKTVMTGIVSNPRQPVGEFVKREWIQTSASISPGFSGGPLFNGYGEVIGILVSKADFAQAGFAIPMDVVARFLGQAEITGLSARRQ